MPTHVRIPRIQTRPAAAYTPHELDGNQGLESFNPRSHPRVASMEGCQHVNDNTTPPPTPLPYQTRTSLMAIRRVPPPHAGAPRAVFSCHAQPPTDPMPSRASVGECATPHARTFNPDPPPLLALPSEPGYAPHVYAASQPLQHRREWVTARRTGRHQQQPDSQELLRRRTRSRPNPAEGLASHSCEAGLSQGHPHIARYHTTTCQQLPTPQRESPTQGFRRLGSHTSLGVG
jgi:hypothetical protein